MSAADSTSVAPGARRSRGFAGALLAAALFGVATPVAKDLLATTPPLALAGLFYLGAALVLAPSTWLRNRRRGTFGLPADRRNRLRLLAAVVFGGILGPVLMLFGLRLASASSVSLWLNLETTATAVLSVWLFREHLGRLGWLGNAGILAAGVMLSFEGGAQSALGGLLVAAAAVCWGVDNNVTALIDGITPTESTFWKGLVAGSTNLGLAAVFSSESVPSEALLPALAVGALSYGVSIVLYIGAAQDLGATRSQMVFATAPAFGVLASVLWLGETLGTLLILAAALFTGSIALLLLEQHEHEHVHEALEHEHNHRHDDGHHEHAHPDQPRSLAHSHVHQHEGLTHAHPHWPDLHHRHAHR